MVEGEAKVAHLLGRGLGEEGPTVDVAGNGGETVWLATKNPYDAIVLDVMLPDVDGFEVRGP